MKIESRQKSFFLNNHCIEELNIPFGHSVASVSWSLVEIQIPMKIAPNPHGVPAIPNQSISTPARIYDTKRSLSENKEKQIQSWTFSSESLQLYQFSPVQCFLYGFSSKTPWSSRAVNKRSFVFLRITRRLAVTSGCGHTLKRVHRHLQVILFVVTKHTRNYVNTADFYTCIFELDVVLTQISIIAITRFWIISSCSTLYLGVRYDKVGVSKNCTPDAFKLPSQVIL